MILTNRDTLDHILTSEIVCLPDEFIPRILECVFLGITCNYNDDGNYEIGGGDDMQQIVIDNNSFGAKETPKMFEGDCPF